MSVRSLAVGAIAVGVAVVALMWALGGDDPPAAPPSEVAGETPESIRSPAPGSEAPQPTSAPPAPRPTLPDKAAVLDTTGAEEQPLWTGYDDEARDDAWADAQEQAIRDRVNGLLDGANRNRPGAVSVEQIGCRARTCRLLVAARDEAAFRTFLESLQDERGFYGDAAELALDGYGESVDKATGDATYQVRVHLGYER